MYINLASEKKKKITSSEQKNYVFKIEKGFFTSINTILKDAQ